MSGEHSSTGLKKSLGLFRLTVYGVGTIIGSGIYAVIAPAASEAGSAIWVSFLLAALASSFTALSYAELASALPSAGAEHNFLLRAFPKAPVIAFAIGFFIAIHGAATFATVALTFASYARPFVDVGVTSIALALIVTFTVVNLIGVKQASWINVTFTVFQVSCLVVLAIIGFSSETFSINISSSLSQPIVWDGVFAATAVIFFIYTGYEHMASMSEEAKRPEDLWKAFLLALIITSVVYLAIIFSTLGIVRTEVLANSVDPLAAAGRSQGVWLGYLITVAALLATANGVLSASLSVSRLLFGMSRAGDLPRALSKVSAASRTPYIALIVVMIVGAIFVVLGEIKTAASVSSFGALLVFALVNLATVILRFKDPQLPRPFKVPGKVGRVPILPCIGVVVSLALATCYSLEVYLIFAASSLVGLGGYNLKGRFEKI